MEWRTLEVRWFFQGSCPADVREWFATGEPVVPIEARTDTYLTTGRPDLGVKIRAGVQLDVKARTGPGSRLGVPAPFEGTVEPWVKWSFPLGDGGVDPGAVYVVDKQRRLRRFALHDGSAVPVPPDEFPATGCAAELVDVQLDGRSWWSLGFEAYGTEAGPALAVACNTLATQPSPIDFSPAACHSYPSWLAERAGLG